MSGTRPVVEPWDIGLQLLQPFVDRVDAAIMRANERIYALYIKFCDSGTGLFENTNKYTRELNDIYEWGMYLAVQTHRLKENEMNLAMSRFLQRVIPVLRAWKSKRYNNIMIKHGITVKDLIKYLINLPSNIEFPGSDGTFTNDEILNIVKWIALIRRRQALALFERVHPASAARAAAEGGAAAAAAEGGAAAGAGGGAAAVEQTNMFLSNLGMPVFVSPPKAEAPPPAPKVNSPVPRESLVSKMKKHLEERIDAIIGIFSSPNYYAQIRAMQIDAERTRGYLESMVNIFQLPDYEDNPRAWLDSPKNYQHEYALSKNVLDPITFGEGKLPPFIGKWTPPLSITKKTKGLCTIMGGRRKKLTKRHHHRRDTHKNGRSRH